MFYQLYKCIMLLIETIGSDVVCSQYAYRLPGMNSEYKVYLKAKALQQINIVSHVAR